MSFAASELRLLVPRFAADGANLWTYDDTVDASAILADYIDGVPGMEVGDKVLYRKFSSLSTKTTISDESFHTVTAVDPETGFATLSDSLNKSKVTLSYVGLSSKASDAAVARFAAPFKFKIVGVFTVLNAALSAGDATFTTAIGGVGVTGGVVTATQSGSAAGDVDSATPTAAHTGAKGALIAVTAGGASTATATANVFVLLEQLP